MEKNNMELLFSNLPPLRTKHNSFNDKFDELLYNADELKIATGYVSVDSLAEMRKIIEFNRRPRLELVIGMHFFQGFTKREYQSALYLNNFLLDKELGAIYLSTAFKFHGKLYSFSNNSKPFAAIIGSNNLSSISEYNRIYETAIFSDDKIKNGELISFINNLVKISKPLSDCKIERFNNDNSLLFEHEDVEKIDLSYLNKNGIEKTDITFKIPLKASKSHLKSNLNVYFGKGREDKRGLIKPRHWYEVELIVPKEITSQMYYPKARSHESVFYAITDDGWKFRCKISGDYSKNLRSDGDLKILGRWIKGRLENFGVLAIGEQVTEETLTAYGRKDFNLTKTNKPNIWLLDFGV